MENKQPARAGGFRKSARDYTGEAQQNAEIRRTFGYLARATVALCDRASVTAVFILLIVNQTLLEAIR